jgi:hypothetical protein
MGHCKCWREGEWFGCGRERSVTVWVRVMALQGLKREHGSLRVLERGESEPAVVERGL